MTDTVIQVEVLGKRYRIAAARERYVALRDVIAHGAKSFGRRLLGRRPQGPGSQEFWALRDISFEVRQGECVGIIGRNGAGKSTLLKLLSRITEPTEGRFRVRGRVASLLEVGTGFHPELTGRENVYLNGSILGMGRKEIDRKFDEIVAFAEVEKFLETPVKYYSSGMYVRLAFAVAAHLDPEILIVDEVLAVGDAEFQKKCLGKMSKATEGGRTVLFVSHNMAAVRALCGRAIVLHKGAALVDGPAADAIDTYLGTGITAGAYYHPPAGNNRLARIDRIFSSVDGVRPTESIDYTDEVSVVTELTVLQACRGLRMGVLVSTAEGTTLFGSSDYDLSNTANYPAGKYVSTCRLPGHLFNSGQYYITVGCDQPSASEQIALYENCLRLDVTDSIGHGAGYSRPPGVVRPAVEWKREPHGFPNS